MYKYTDQSIEFSNQKNRPTGVHVGKDIRPKKFALK